MIFPNKLTSYVSIATLLAIASPFANAGELLSSDGSSVKGVSIGSKSSAPIAKRNIPVAKKRVHVAKPPKSVEKDVLLLGRLKGIVLAAVPKQVKAKSTAKGITVADKHLIVPNSVKRFLSGRLNKPLTKSNLKTLTVGLIKSYKDAGYQTVNVLTPPQEVTGGTLQMLVIVGRMGNLLVEGNKYFSSDFYKKGFSTKKGEPLTTQKIVGDLRYLNRSNFRKVDLIYKPGKGYGQTDVVIRATEAEPRTFYAGMNNTGTKSFGKERLFVGMQLGNLLDRGHELDYRFTTNTKDSTLNSHNLSYRIPLANRQELKLTGAFSKYDGVINGLNQKGDSKTYGARYTRQVAPILGYTGDLIAGIKRKNINGGLLFGDDNLRDEKSKYTQASLGWSGEKNDSAGLTRLHIEAVQGIAGNLNINGNKTKADHKYLNAGYNHRRNFRNNAVLLTTVSGRYTKDRLPSAESFYLGGKGSVRGWEQNAQRVDRGVTGNVTVMSPNLLQGRFNGQALRSYAFVDGGTGIVNKQTAGAAKRRSMLSAGVGVNYQLGRHMTLDLSYGRQLKEKGFDDGKKGGFHGGITIRYGGGSNATPRSNSATRSKPAAAMKKSVAPSTKMKGFKFNNYDSPKVKAASKKVVKRRAVVKKQPKRVEVKPTTSKMKGFTFRKF